MLQQIHTLFLLHVTTLLGSIEAFNESCTFAVQIQLMPIMEALKLSIALLNAVIAIVVDHAQIVPLSYIDVLIEMNSREE